MSNIINPRPFPAGKAEKKHFHADPLFGLCLQQRIYIDADAVRRGLSAVQAYKQQLADAAEKTFKTAELDKAAAAWQQAVPETQSATTAAQSVIDLAAGDRPDASPTVGADDRQGRTDSDNPSVIIDLEEARRNVQASHEASVPASAPAPAPSPQIGRANGEIPHAV